MLSMANKDVTNTVGFLRLRMWLGAIEMKMIVLRADKSKCQCSRCKLSYAKRVSGLRIEINRLIGAAKQFETSELTLGGAGKERV